MKEVRRNIWFIAAVFITLFVVLVVSLVYNTAIYGGRWVNSPYNPRLREQRALVTPGDILDRNGVVLATTDDQGNRIYNGRKAVRKAYCHVVGDAYGFCPTGAETFHASTLLGYNADILSQIRQVLLQEPVRGNDLTLTIDVELQTLAASQLGSQKGAIALINYKTGEILALASTPGFDPSAIEGAESIADFSSEDAVLINRATQGRYVPGSIFKVVTAIAALERAGISTTWEFACTGSIEVDGGVVTCSGVHGKVNLVEAFAQSCNTAFAALGLEVGGANMAAAAEKAGFNEDFMFQDLTLYSSRYEMNAYSDDYDLAWSAIGQNTETVTPLHMAMLAGAVANGGIAKEPRLVVRSDTVTGFLRSTMTDQRYMGTATAQTIQEMMLETVASGTGKKAAVAGYEVAGKTGTAEVGGSKSPHAWFIGYVADSDHPLAIAVVVENGGGGGSVAAPIASAVFAEAIQSGY